MDLVSDFSVPLAMQVIAGMIAPLADWTRYKQWSDVILFSYTRSGGEVTERATRDFIAVTFHKPVWSIQRLGNTVSL